jgi:hypothetical protein
MDQSNCLTSLTQLSSNVFMPMAPNERCGQNSTDYDHSIETQVLRFLKVSVAARLLMSKMAGATPAAARYWP